MRLTDLPNRALASTCCAAPSHRTRRQGERRFAALMVNIDRFATPQRRPRPRCRRRTAARFGSRLATAVRPVTSSRGWERRLPPDSRCDARSQSEAERVADRVQLVLREPLHVLVHDVPSRRASASRCTTRRSNRRGLRPQRRTRDAGSEGRGGARHVIYRPGDARRRAAPRLARARPAHGDCRGEMMVWYQPVFSARDNSTQLVGLRGAPALGSSQRGFLGPVEFVPLAEETG
jgi:hypothetical protein